jgi:LysR family transcriptional regulator, transcription activator of glutamate synthase operon
MRLAYDFEPMETDTLRWLLAVADGATVSETAARFHTTQPAVTRGLQRLGHAYGVALTERDGRRIRLTFAGQIVASSARRALVELDDGARAVREADDPATGTARLGFLSPLGTWMVPRLLGEFRAERPGVSFELRQDGAARILTALREGALDLLLTSEPDIAGVNWEPLFDDQLVVVVPASHRLAGRRRLRIAELRDEPWILLPEGYGLRAAAERLCAEAGFAPRMAFEGADLSTLLALIASGNGVGLFAQGPAPPDGVREIPVAPRASRWVGLAAIPGRVRPRVADEFADAVRRSLGQLK